MTAPVQLSGGAVALGAGLLVGGLLIWKASQTGAGLLKTVGQAVEQAAASVQSGFQNNMAGPWQRGTDYMAGVAPVVSSKAWLYSDYGYTGKDASGQIITDGEWYGDAEARRYDAEQRANGGAPAATSNNGAAFGVYPKAPIKQPADYNFGVTGGGWS